MAKSKEVLSIKARLQTLIAGATLLSTTGCPQQNARQDLATTISEVQSGAVKACNFLPVADSVAKLIPYVSTASGVVDLLCKALIQAQAAGTTGATAAALPGSNITVPVNTAAGTVIVAGSLVQPGAPGPRRSSSNGQGNAAPAAAPLPPVVGPGTSYGSGTRSETGSTTAAPASAPLRSYSPSEIVGGGTGHGPGAGPEIPGLPQ
jgi:hypothetical protein